MSNEKTITNIQVSLAELKKDLEYIIQANRATQDEMHNIRKDVNELRGFYQKWKGGALVLMALGGVLTWIIEAIFKVLPFLDK